jgi:hypothetical protein
MIELIAAAIVLSVGMYAASTLPTSALAAVRTPAVVVAVASTSDRSSAGADARARCTSATEFVSPGL